MTASSLQALIFDVGGTLADTETAHLAAFNHAFARQGMGWHWDKALYTQLLEISGGKERMLLYWQQRNYAIDAKSNAAQDTIAELHQIKNAAYEAMVQAGGVSLRPGVLELIEQARTSGLLLAIATTTSPVNIAALLRKAIGPYWRQYFSAIGDASTAPIKKPHPQVYLQMLQALQMPRAACLAFEDSGNGLRAACAAGLATVITPTEFTAHHDFTGAICVVPDLKHTSLEQLGQLHLENFKEPVTK